MKTDKIKIKLGDGLKLRFPRKNVRVWPSRGTSVDVPYKKYSPIEFSLDNTMPSGNASSVPPQRSTANNNQSTNLPTTSVVLPVSSATVTSTSSSSSAVTTTVSTGSSSSTSANSSSGNSVISTTAALSSMSTPASSTSSSSSGSSSRKPVTKAPDVSGYRIISDPQEIISLMYVLDQEDQEDGVLLESDESDKSLSGGRTITAIIKQGTQGKNSIQGYITYTYNKEKQNTVYLHMLFALPGSDQETIARGLVDCMVAQFKGKEIKVISDIQEVPDAVLDSILGSCVPIINEKSVIIGYRYEKTFNKRPSAGTTETKRG